MLLLTLLALLALGIALLNVQTGFVLRSGRDRAPQPPGFRPLTHAEVRESLRPVNTAFAQSWLAMVPGLLQATQRRWREAGLWIAACIAAALQAMVMLSLGFRHHQPLYNLAGLLLVAGVFIAQSRSAYPTSRHRLSDLLFQRAMERLHAADTRQPSCPRCRAAERNDTGFCPTCFTELSATPLAPDAPRVRAIVAPDRSTNHELRALRGREFVAGSIAGDAMRIRARREVLAERTSPILGRRLTAEPVAAFTDPVDERRVWLVIDSEHQLRSRATYAARAVTLAFYEDGKLAARWAMSPILERTEPAPPSRMRRLLGTLRGARLERLTPRKP